MPPNAHAMLGPSSAHRWLACTVSALREAGMPNEPSEASAEGTLAHAIVETKLDRLIAGQPRGTATDEQKQMSFGGKKLYNSAMENHTDGYVDFIEELYATACRHSPDAVLASEMRVDFSDWVPGGHGTTDTVIIADDEMYVIDFKYGKNHHVYAQDNPQLRLYALGTYAQYSDLYDIKTIHTYIVQPRSDDISSEDLTVEALLEWADRYVKPRAALAAAGLGEASPSEATCQWCKAKATCKERNAAHLEAMRAAFAQDTGTFTDDELAALLPEIEILISWGNSIKDLMMKSAIAGKTYPGYKLVRGRATRRITDEEKAAQLLRDKFGDQVYRLKGITDLEEIVGRKQFSEMLGGLIVRSEGKLSLVPEDDKRPAYSRADDMFND